MENKLSYFNKYLKYKNKYIKLQKQLKGGEDKQWGFGVEQEFPIFIKPSDIDKNNINKLGFDVTLFRLNDIIQHINIKPYYFIFLDLKKILELDEIIKRDRRSILKIGIDIEEILITRGVVDALDHSSPKFAVGGKLGLDCTGEEVEELGIDLLSDEELLLKMQEITSEIKDLKQYFTDTKNPVTVITVLKNRK